MKTDLNSLEHLGMMSEKHFQMMNYCYCLMAVALELNTAVVEVGELVHVISDAHIYDRHIPLIKELIKRETYPAPKFSLNPEVKDFYDFTVDDIKIENYQKGPQITNIPIAI